MECFTKLVREGYLVKFHKVEKHYNSIYFRQLVQSQEYRKVEKPIFGKSGLFSVSGQLLIRQRQGYNRSKGAKNTPG